MACHVCGESRFQNSAQLQCHLSKNHAEFSCNCGRRFMTENSLKQHENDKKKNEKMFPCGKCCCSFDSKDKEIQHKRSLNHWKAGERDEAQVQIRRVFCDDRCGRSFKSSDALNNHKRDMLAKVGIDENTCRACENKFPTRDRLDQHRRDTRHSSSSSNRAKENMDYLYKNKLAISREDQKESVKVAQEKVNEVLNYIYTKNKDGKLYSPDLRHAGSYPMKTKIGKADEFDMNVYLNVRDCTVLTRGAVGYGYDNSNVNLSNLNKNLKMVEMKDGQRIPAGFAVVKPNTDVPEHLKYNGDLIPREVKLDFYEKVKTAIKELDLTDVVLNKATHGPAVTLTIKQPGGHDINVDLTLAIGSVFIPVNDDGWPRPSTQKAFSQETITKVLDTGMYLVPKGDVFWNKSYQRAEKVLFENLDQGNGCRREINKFIKRYLKDCASKSPDGLKGMSSHPLKHIVLWACENRPDSEYWHKRNSHNCLIDTIDDTIKAMRTRKLPNYFNTSDNILKGKDPKVLDTFADYLKKERSKLLHL